MIIPEWKDEYRFKYEVEFYCGPMEEERVAAIDLGKKSVDDSITQKALTGEEVLDFPVDMALPKGERPDIPLDDSFDFGANVK